MDDISVGPDEGLPANDNAGKTVSGVDAQDVTDRELQQGIGGVEAKPFSPARGEEPEAAPRRPNDEGSAGLAKDRRNPGRDAETTDASTITPKGTPADDDSHDEPSAP